MSVTSHQRTVATPGSARLGERVRQLRVAAGLTQTDLAGDRFSKEYVSQIERGKTRPTRETIEWLAGKLGVDAGFLERGVSADERSRVETMLARAEALTKGDRYEEAIAEYDNMQTALLATGAVDLEVRALSGQAWARVQGGDVRGGLQLLERARVLAERPEFGDIDRADILYRMGVCRYKLSSNATALGLLNEALALAEGSGLPCDALRSEIFRSRSLCYRKQRDLEAAREDVELALELAEALDDRRTMADVFLQASLVAERMGQWVLARSYAERARAHYEELEDGRSIAGVLNNLGGLNLMLGRPEQAIEHLKASFSTALEVDSVESAAQAEGSLATVHLHLEDWTQAEQLARHALSLVKDREDFLHEIAPTQLVLGRALMAQDKLDEAEQWFRASDSSAERLESIGHRAAAWIALGDLETKRNNEAEAARLYRLAAEALQDVRF
ncbi:MAG TPA: tetratricopeptide repeat protein [Gaiellaceae bacterium]